MKLQGHGHTQLALALIGAAVVSATAAAQSTRIGGGVVMQAAFAFYWETRLDPPVPPLSQSFGTAVLEVGPDVVQRVMLDREQKVYFGYEAKVEALRQNNQFRVTFQPLTMTAELQQTLGGDGSKWQMLPTPRFAAPRTIRAGDVLELPLLTGSMWNQTVTDYVTVREPERRPEGFQDLRRPEFFTALGAPRDFRAQDVELRLDEPTVTVASMQAAGIPVAKEAARAFAIQRLTSPADVSGAVVWIYIPNSGRFLLSLVPEVKAGFQKRGEVRGSSLRFSTPTQTISVTSKSKIAPGQAAFNLYVLHDAGWAPTYPNANRETISVGAADAAEFLVGR